MAISEKINRYVQEMPESVQVEVLDFVEFLLKKSERTPPYQEEREWSELSLTLAMRGMETEDEPIYTPNDIKECFS
jgi:hypothetical protein